LALHGNIADFGVADIIQLITYQRKSGVLTFEGLTDRVSIGFREGKIYAAYSEAHSERYELVNYLVSRKLISTTRRDELRKAQEQSGLAPQDLLLMEGAITLNTIREFAEHKVTEILLDLFTWPYGQYHFDAGAVLYDRSAVTIDLNAEAILMEGLRWHDEIMQIVAQLPDEKVALQRVEGAEVVGAEHHRLLELFAAPTPLREVVSRSPFDLQRTYRLIKELFDAGALREAPSPQAAPHAPLPVPVTTLSRNELTALVENLVRLITRGIVSRSLYPPNHPMMASVAASLGEFIERVLREQGPLQLLHLENQLHAQQVSLPYDHDQFRSFIETLKKRGIRGFTFLPGLTRSELEEFLGILGQRHEDVSKRGGIGKLFAEAGITHIQLIPIDSAQFQPRFGGDASSWDGEVTWGSLFDRLKVPQEVVELVRQDPQRIADLIVRMTGLSERPAPEEQDLHLEVVRSSLGKIGNSLDQVEDLAEDERSDLLASIFQRLPLHVQRRLFLGQPSGDAPFDMMVNQQLLAMSVADQAELFVSEFEQEEKALADASEEEREWSLAEFHEMLLGLLERVEAAHGPQRRQELHAEIQRKLFECGIPIRRVNHLFGDEQGPSSRLLNFLNRIESRRDPLEILAPESIQEFRELADEFISTKNDYSLSLLVSPYTKTLASDSWEARHRAADLLREIAEAMAEGKRFDVLDDLVDNLLLRLDIETVFEVYRVLASCLEKVAILVRKQGEHRISGKISRTFAEHLQGSSGKSLQERELVAHALGRIGDEKSISALVKALEDKRLHQQSAASLLDIGAEIAEPLIDLLKTSEKQAVRWRICQLLEDLGPPVIEPLLKELHNPRWYVRRNAVMILGRVATTEVIPALAPLLRDEVWQVRREAAIAIGNLGGPEAEAHLIEALNDEHSAIRRNAVLLLGRVGGSRAVTALIELLRRRVGLFRSEDDEIRREACIALGMLGDERAVEPLADILNEISFFSWSRKRQLCLSAIQALGRIGGSQAKALLMQLGKSRNATLRQVALDSLEAIHSMETPH
jgi:HEAT repeat protein